MKIPWKQWIADESTRLGLSRTALLNRIYRGTHPMPKRTVKNKRVVEVISQKESL